MTDDVFLVKIGRALWVDSTVIDRIIVTLAQEISLEFSRLFVLHLLEARDPMHNRNVLSLHSVDDYIADIDLIILEKH